MNEVQIQIGVRAKREEMIVVFHRRGSGDGDVGRIGLARRQQAIDELVKPLRDSLARVDEKIHAIEIARAGAYATLTDQVKTMSEGQVNLREETRKLSSALKSPIARGR